MALLNFKSTMKAIYNYCRNVINAFISLINGMRVTGYYISHPKQILTQQYPNNRATLYIPGRFKGRVILPHDENNEHKCTGCSICQMSCPNGSITILTVTEELPDGKKKKRLDRWEYNHGMCTLCNLCIESCPSDAIKMENHFEFAVYDRKNLIYDLNKPGSKLKEKSE